LAGSKLLISPGALSLRFLQQPLAALAQPERPCSEQVVQPQQPERIGQGE